MDISFDVRAVAKRIRDARIEKNMTQMNLADEIGVSCQAVSNWERGNSMPDISKLRELCAILEIPIDYLLGGDMSTAVEKGIDHIEGKPTELTEKELRAIAPIMPPDKVEDMAENAVASGNNISAAFLCTLAPYLNSDSLESMVDKIELADGNALTDLAPFLSEQALDRLAGQVETIDAGTLTRLAPLLQVEAVDRLVGKVGTIDAGTLTRLAPFLSGEALAALAAKLANTRK